jgi:hypothetical protein
MNAEKLKIVAKLTIAPNAPNDAKLQLIREMNTRLALGYTEGEHTIAGVGSIRYSLRAE